MKERSSSSKKSWSTAVAMAVTLSPLLMARPARSEANYDQGVRLYQAHNYQAALQSFDASNRVHQDPNTIYYAAVCHQALGHKPQAAKLYSLIVQRFGGTPAAQLAATALAKMDPNAMRAASGAMGGGARSAAPSSRGVQSYGGSSGGGSSLGDTVIAPPETRVRYDGSTNMAQVTASVNGRPIPMLFDTGAAVTVFGFSHLQQLGIQPPTGKATNYSMGVGDGGRQETWEMRVDLKVGAIERKNFPIIVQKEIVAPLLGQTFYRDFQYTIHPESHEIEFVRKDARAQTGGVPFKREGVHLIVNVDINGRTMPVIFDTGAGTCAFTQAQAAAAGLKADDDSPTEQVMGAAGATNARVISVSRMKLGPIDKTGVRASIVENAQMPHPLLGQTFFGDWQYTIDNSNNLIYFLRR